jgi:Uma2 family endonuclease
MATREQTYTNEAFWEFVERPENADKNFELIYGVLVEVPSPSLPHGMISAKIAALFIVYLDKNDIGYAVGDSMDFDLASGVILKPDAAFISKARLPIITNRVNIAPDIAVEIVSPSNTPTELLHKAETYLRYGTQQVWVIYPDERLVYVYTAGDAGSLNLRKYTEADTLTGGDILPEFSVSVAKIFP